MSPRSTERHATDRPRNNRIKDLRLELGLTRVELAKLADLSEKTVDRAEHGKQDLRETTCRKIFNALNKARAKESLRALAYQDLFPKQDAGGVR